MTRFRRQRGVAMVLLLAMISMGTTWLVVSRLNAASNDWLTAKRAHNTRVLAQAKQALIGYVAAQANKAGENYPGSLPCPEDPGNFDSAASQGKVGSGCASSLKVGRFPWRTLGLDQLRDADGEPLWYVVSTSWGPGAVINSNTTAGLTVDGVANAAIAIIIAPGASLNVDASSGCTAWNQARATTGTPDWRNYLECENATSPADSSFVTTGPSGSFNDQVMTLKAAEIMPAIEASVANRIEREIVPVLKSVYSSTDWGSGVSTTTPAYPFAATFGDPSTSNYQGSAGTYAGLLPFSYQPSGTCGTDARCTATLHAWSTPTITKSSGTGTLYSPAPYSCSTITQTVTGTTYNRVYCYGWYQTGSMRLTYDDRISGIGRALRTFTLSHYTSILPPEIYTYNYDTGVWSSITPTQTRSFNSDGSFSFSLSATLPTMSGWGYFEFYTTRPAFSDHALLSSTDDDTGWFVRNEWYRLVYYAAAQGHTGTSTPSCTTSSSCLSVSNVAPTGAQQAILILAGRSVNGTARPSATLTNYLEYGNATGRYEKQNVSPVALTAAYSDVGSANAYDIPASSISDRPVYFVAANANTGAATLVTPATLFVPKAIVNVDGSALTAGQIPANGVVGVTYDGSQYTLRKSPFNDRVMAVSSN